MQTCVLCILYMCCANTANTLKVLHQEIEKEKKCSYADLCVVYVLCQYG